MPYSIHAFLWAYEVQHMPQYINACFIIAVIAIEPAGGAFLPDLMPS